MNGQEKKIYVNVEPPCISWNREMQYIREVQRAYEEGRLAQNMKIELETDEEVVIRYNR